MSRAARSRGERVETLVLVGILLVVGVAAGAASFTHVHDWTMANSPTGTPDWFGWANACISELVPVAALLTIRRRRREGKPFGYPMFLLVCAVALSLAAQLAVAKPGISGWLLSAVPALAFLGLSKLILTTKPALPTAPAAADHTEAISTGLAQPPTAVPVQPPTVEQGPVEAAPVHQPTGRRIVPAPGVIPISASAVTRANRSEVGR